jgi:chaperonin cofactor prefoldin
MEKLEKRVAALEKQIADFQKSYENDMQIIREIGKKLTALK